MNYDSVKKDEAVTYDFAIYQMEPIMSFSFRLCERARAFVIFFAAAAATEDHHKSFRRHHPHHLNLNLIRTLRLPDYIAIQF